MKKKRDSAIKFLAGTLAAAVLCCMVSVSMVKPEKVQAQAAEAPVQTEAPVTASMNVADLTLPLGSSFRLSASLSDPEQNENVTWTWESSNTMAATVASDGTVTAAKDAEVVSRGAVKTTISAKASSGQVAYCPVTINPKITSPVSTPNTPSTPTTPTQPSTDPTNPSTPGDTPTEPTNPSTPTTPTEPDTPAPGTDNPPVAPNPGPVETVPPADTVITGVVMQDDGTIVKQKVLVTNAIVDIDGTKYITDGLGKKFVNKIVTTQSGTKYGTLADGRVAWSATFTLGGKKYFAGADGVIAVKKFSTTPYDHRVYSKADGTLVRNKLFKVNGKRYYASKSGALAHSKWVKVGNTKYYCNAKGVITKSKKA